MSITKFTTDKMYQVTEKLPLLSLHNTANLYKQSEWSTNVLKHSGNYLYHMLQYMFTSSV
jgi:hypothetical protein